MRKAKKLLVFISMISILSMLPLNVSAGSQTTTITTDCAIEIDASYRPAGEHIGMIGVDSISSGGQVFEIMYGPGFTVVSRTFDSRGSSTRYYTLSGLTQMHFSVEKRSSGSCTVGMKWSYDY